MIFAIFALAWVVARPLARSRLGIVMDALICVAALCQWSFYPIAPWWHIQWQKLPFYLLCGLMLFFGSVLFATNSRWEYLSRPVIIFGKGRCRRLLPIVVFSPVHEEIVWRVAAQTLMISVLGEIPSILIVATSFTLWHRDHIGTNFLLQLELFIFSLLLGFGMAAMSDPIFVMTLHAVRNFFIFCTSFKHAQA